MELYKACAGDWSMLVKQCGITTEELEHFLEYAGSFLCNLGNYYVSLTFGQHCFCHRSADPNRARATRSLCPI